MPQSIHHCKLDDWELFDMDKAGCRLCGRIHVCNPATCHLTNNEGHQVCQITGYCVKNLVFADDEFVSTVSLIPTQYISVKRTVEKEQVSAWVNQILCSDSTRKSIACEIRKRQIKKTAIFTRLSKHYKATKTPINLIEMASTTQHAMNSTRVPALLESEELEALAAHCGETITLFMHKFLKAMHGLIPSVKMQGFVVGVLYLMRTGIRMCDSVEILSSVEELKGCLPLESQLWALFRMQNKVITEAENILKSTLKSLSRNQLLDLGFV